MEFFEDAEIILMAEKELDKNFRHQEVSGLNAEISFLQKELRESILKRIAAQQQTAQLKERLAEMGKENRQLRAHLAKTKKEMREISLIASGVAQDKLPGCIGEKMERIANLAGEKEKNYEDTLIGRVFIKEGQEYDNYD